ncbi:hypothetical protein ACFLU6_14660, partial [Acidobacteriota bacterium]
MSRSHSLLFRTTISAFSFIVLLLAVFTWSVKPAAAQDCVPDFRPLSTKTIVPLSTNPIEPGGRVEVTIHLCNSGDDPMGPGCPGSPITMEDWADSAGYFDNIEFTYWDPDVWSSPLPGAACQILPVGNPLCATNLIGVFDPSNPVTGGCTDVVWEADVKKT